MPSHLNRVRVAALAATASAALALTGCGGPAPSAGPSAAASSPSASAASPSASPAATPTPTTSVQPQSSLDAITVTGAPGQAPTVKVKTPYAVDQTRAKVLSAGKGATVPANGAVEVQYFGVNGRTGQHFNSSWRDNKAQPVVFPLDQVVPGFKKGLEGKKVGDRVLVAMPGSDGYDASGGSADVGIQVGDTLVFVVDILSTELSGPSGQAVAPKAGLPTVADEGGKPAITVPTSAAPSAMVAQPLIQGDQARKVAADDFIKVHYRSASWKTRTQLEDKYAQADTGQLSATIPCWQKGLKDSPVGSRVLLVCPPQDGFPQGSNNPPVEKGDTVVYVIDILFASKQPLG